MSEENVILSYPRSGNHLCRFFIELLSETPTFGCKTNNTDIEIYKNIFTEEIPFNIKKNYNKSDAYYKYHGPNPLIKNPNLKKIIFIIRNPREVLLRHNNYNLKFNYFRLYFRNIDFYNKITGKKILFYYEDIITNKIEFINKLYEFLEIDNIEKKKYVLENIDKLYNLSLNGKKRNWGGNVSKGSLDFYYKKLPKFKKDKFDIYLNEHLKIYPFLREKYFI